jgi:hypothetical protein
MGYKYNETAVRDYHKLRIYICSYLQNIFSADVMIEMVLKQK